MRLNLCHVLLYGQLLALKEPALLALVYIKTGKCVDEKVWPAVVKVTLNHDISHCRGLLCYLFLELDGLWTEVVRIDEYFVVISRFKSESFWNDVLLSEIESTHGPLLVAFKGHYWITIAVFHSISNITLEQIEHFQELLPDSVNCAFILFVCFSNLLEASVGTEFDLLGVVDGLLLTYRSIEVNMFLLEGTH